MSTEHRDGIAKTGLFCVLGTLISCGLWYQGQTTGKPEFVLYGTLGISVVTVIAAFSFAYVVAAGADYMKTIADQQTAALERKRAAAAPPPKDEPSFLQQPPQQAAPSPQYKGRTLGKPEL